MNIKNWSFYIAGFAFGLLLIVGGIGTCIKYANPTPAPVPLPVPLPAPKPSPNDIWKQLLMPTKNASQGIKLPAPLDISASKKFVFVTADCPGEVRWLVSNQNAKSPIQVLESQLTNTVMIFPGSATENDLIVIIAYTAQGNIPSDPAITYIRIKADKPPPAPIPVPEPTPTPEPVTSLHVTFILDYNKMTRALSEVVNDKGMRDYLTKAGHEIHEISIRDDIEGLGLKKYITNLTVPVVIFQDKKGTVLASEQLTSIQQIKDIVTKLTGK